MTGTLEMRGGSIQVYNHPIKIHDDSFYVDDGHIQVYNNNGWIAVGTPTMRRMGFNSGKDLGESAIRSYDNNNNVTCNLVFGDDSELYINGKRLQHEAYINSTTKIKENDVEIAPTGEIKLFNTLNKIPAGWVICDGKNGTPDMTQEFKTYKSDSGDIEVVYIQRIK
jgi:hypothetical protein